MALSALSALVAQHGFAKMEEVFQLLREREELQARIAAALSQEQEQAADPMEPALVPVEVLGSSPVRRRSGNVFELASEEQIAQITKSIDEGHLRSDIKTVSWNPTAKHYPGSVLPLEVLTFLRSCPHRMATKEQLLEGLSPRWSWAYVTGNPHTLSHFLRELEKQKIIIRT
jgi:DNA-binding response OmpR family regulator